MNPITIVEQCYEKLSSQMRGEPWKYTGHGRNVLQNEDELNAYIAAYGEIHIIKCRAALQNFPFDNLRMYPYEIFDWGCGQGIATLTLIDMLYERSLLSGLRKITLVEPSDIALQRAKKWIACSAGPGIEIHCVNKFIPTDETEKWDDVNCTVQSCINLFSNILDIHSLSLSWLAHKTASLAGTTYMICVGPKYSGNTRIADFCGYFRPKSFFSDISTYPYAYTTKTHHAFGCETKCFVHSNRTMLNDAYQECANECTFIDDYDYAAECLRGIVGDNLLNLYNAVRHECEKIFDVFLRPSINSDVPDMVLANKGNGILLLNVCENLDNLEIEFNRIEGIKNSIFNTHLRTIKIDSVTNTSVYNCVKTALYFPNGTDSDLQRKIAEVNGEKNKRVAENSKITIPNNKDHFEFLIKICNLSEVKMLNNVYSRSFRYDYYSELLEIIIGRWHSYKEGDANFRLSKRQESIVRSPNQKVRVKGVAGCGKTQVIANRAVEQHLRTGDKVLIITFNISLIQYIRMRINQVPADFAMNKFEITNYHQFFISMANKYAENIPWGAADQKDFFGPYANKISKYKTIIIDEVQDFKEEWLSSIIKYFLEKNGSISVFGDGEQNIYNRKMEVESKMPTIPTFSGSWGEINERISMRILNPNIASLSSKFSKEFVAPDINPLTTQNEIMFDDYKIKYWNIGVNKLPSCLAQNISWIIDKFHLETKDVVVLGQSISLLRDIEEAYVRNTREKTMLNFETASQYEEVTKKVASVYIKKNLDDIRRTAKTHFTTDCLELKFSTIHSFKGWEAKSVILFLQPENCKNKQCDGFYIQERENTPALIYTALTRAKCNLFIINLGNDKYDKFFKDNIK